jgi:hypothetical protein
VIVDHAGYDGFACEVDTARIWTGQAGNLLARPYGDNLLAAYRDGLGDRKRVIDRNNFTVGQNEVGRLSVHTDGRTDSSQQNND